VSCDPGSNVTAESDEHSKKHLWRKTATDAGREMERRALQEENALIPSTFMRDIWANVTFDRKISFSEHLSPIQSNHESTRNDVIELFGIVLLRIRVAPVGGP
jgi:hypothetical protein